MLHGSSKVSTALPDVELNQDVKSDCRFGFSAFQKWESLCLGHQQPYLRSLRRTLICPVYLIWCEFSLEHHFQRSWVVRINTELWRSNLWYALMNYPTFFCLYTRVCETWVRTSYCLIWHMHLHSTTLEESTGADLQWELRHALLKSLLNAHHYFAGFFFSFLPF